jgi:hypothetical protein
MFIVHRELYERAFDRSVLDWQTLLMIHAVQVFAALILLGIAPEITPARGKVRLAKKTQ